MRSPTRLTAVRPEFRAFQEVLTHVYPIVPRGIFDRSIDVMLIESGFLCGVYFKVNGTLLSSVIIRRYDNLFPIMVASLQKLRQPRSVMITAESTSDLYEDEGPECSDSNLQKVVLKYESGFGTNLYWYKWWPL